MGAPLFSILAVGQSPVAKPGLCIADWANVANGYESTSGLYGTPTAFGFARGGLSKLEVTSSGVAISELGINNPDSLPANGRVLVWTSPGGRVGILGLPASNGLAIVGTTAGGLSWGTVVPGPHSHSMSSGTLVFDADLIPTITVTYSLGTSALKWKDLYCKGITATEDSVFLSGVAPTWGTYPWTGASVAVRAAGSNLIGFIPSPSSGGEKVLKWSSGIIQWMDDLFGSGGTGIPEPVGSGIVNGRSPGNWVPLKQASWDTSLRWGIPDLTFNSHIVPTDHDVFDIGNNLVSPDTRRWRNGFFGALDLTRSLNVGTTATVGGAATIQGAFRINTVPESATPATMWPLVVHTDSGGVITSNVTRSGKVAFKSWLSLQVAEIPDLVQALIDRPTGTGTTNEMAVWTGSRTLGGSSATYDGFKFEFRNNVQITKTGGTSGDFTALSLLHGTSLVVDGNLTGGGLVALQNGARLRIDSVYIPSPFNSMTVAGGTYALLSTGGAIPTLTWTLFTPGAGGIEEAPVSGDASARSPGRWWKITRGTNIDITYSDPLPTGPQTMTISTPCILDASSTTDRYARSKNVWYKLAASGTVTLTASGTAGSETLTIGSPPVVVTPDNAPDTYAHAKMVGAWLRIIGSGIVTVTPNTSTGSVTIGLSASAGGIPEPTGVGVWVRYVATAGGPGVWKELVGSAATAVITT